MPAVVACPKCQKKYQLPDQMLGKGVKCTQCQTLFKAAPARSATGVKYADPRNTAAKQQALAQHAQALKAMGVEGTIERPADVFAGAMPMPGTADPLANHMVQDPGFGAGAEEAIAPEVAEKPADPLASMFANPALIQEEKRKRQGTSRKRKKGIQLTDPWFILSAVFVPLFLLSLGSSWMQWMSPNNNWLFAVTIFGLFSLVTVAIWVWGMVLVYQVSESVVQLLLCIFVPFYILYFLYVNWEAMREYGQVFVASIVISFLAAFALNSAMLMMAAEVVN